MRSNGWHGESYRHYLAAKGIRSGNRSYMRWKSGPVVDQSGRAVPSFLVWRTPHEDLMEALEQTEAEKRSLNDAIIGASGRIDQTRKEQFLKALDEVRAKENMLLDIKMKDLAEKTHLAPPTVPARESSLWDDAARLQMASEQKKLRDTLEALKQRRAEEVERIRREEYTRAREWAKEAVFRKTKPVPMSTMRRKPFRYPRFEETGGVV